MHPQIDYAAAKLYDVEKTVACGHDVALLPICKSYIL